LRAIVDPVLRLMMAAVRRYGGYVAQSSRSVRRAAIRNAHCRLVT
jgi:hypothetical protein